ncbi:hypothetical protein GEV02_20550 [Rugamonas sp. FT29W]|uniref:Uncharacterized protein n=1 Tax=Rugamonas aquatica TaxID=2743357 RepID=A0A6A7N6L5_9BURK|nr:hypothetical protein [Rugamonas aquatica]
MKSTWLPPLIVQMLLSAGAALAVPAPAPVPAPMPAPSSVCAADPYATDPVTGEWCGWVPGRPGVPDCSRLVC